jgi:hypothetical protein
VAGRRTHEGDEEYKKNYVIFQHYVALYRSDFGAVVPSKRNVVHCSLFVFIGHYTCRANWPPSGVQVVVVKDSAAHCNAVFFPSLVIFGYVSYHQFHLGVLGLYVVAFCFVLFVSCGCLECSCWGGSSVVLVGHHNRSTKQTKQKQPRATHITEITRGNYNRRKDNRITVSSRTP